MPLLLLLLLVGLTSQAGQRMQLPPRVKTGGTLGRVVRRRWRLKMSTFERRSESCCAADAQMVAMRNLDVKLQAKPITIMCPKQMSCIRNACPNG
jgi:hypothetical protein